VSDLLLTLSPYDNDNLLAEGVPAEKIHLVGNIMIDSLLRHLPVASFDRVRDRIPSAERAYAVLTLHRPSNVDNLVVLQRILSECRRSPVSYRWCFRCTRARASVCTISGWTDRSPM
jgi:UDP-N-acetylglucosamine 2-epimerase (non-hydrolysing)